MIKFYSWILIIIIMVIDTLGIFTHVVHTRVADVEGRL